MNVLFLPDYPDKEFYTIVAVFMRLGWFATRDPDADHDFAMLWQDSTWVDECAPLTRLAATEPVLNLRCRDISKRRVEEEFRRQFGRSTFVDPASHVGRAVQKHDENARGGKVVELPLQGGQDTRFVFQRLIDSSQGGLMVEYRVPVILGGIPVVYRELKELPSDSIKTVKHSVEIIRPEEAFSDGERDGILAFCGRMGLDFGELDILRDNQDQEIYILDANKTPGGFGMLNKVRWRTAQRQQAIDALAAALEEGIRLRLRDFGS